MSKRRLLLAGAALALLLVVGSALSVARSADVSQSQNFNARNHPMMRYGGPLERTLRIVPPLHRKFWPMPVFL
jgi:hypothetical protein